MGQRSEEAAGSEACMAFCAPICAESRILRGAARRAVIPCADRQETGICSRLRRVRAAERRKEYGTVVSPAQRTAAAAERLGRRLR